MLTIHLSLRQPPAFVVMGLLLLVVDQAAKRCVERRLPLDAEQTLWDGVLTLTHAPNVGVALGWLQHIPEVGLVISLASVFGILIFSLALTALASRIPVRLAAGLSCALAGAAGNALDRLRLGYVIDFIGLPNGLILNLADLMIVLGVLLIARPLWNALEAPAMRAEPSSHAGIRAAGAGANCGRLDYSSGRLAYYNPCGSE
jgi:signal peptidase II